MLIWFLAFSLLTTVAAIMGFTDIAGETQVFSKIVFYLFFGFSLLALALDLAQR